MVNRARVPEIDILRGIAIILMIAFHFIFNINYFAGFGPDASKYPVLLLGRLAVISFLLLVGISLTLSYSKIKNKLSKEEIIRKYLLRGAMIFSLGMIITIITYFAFPKEYIRFGVLHLIGISIVLSIPFLNKKYRCLDVGIGAILLGFFLRTIVSEKSWLLWLGIRPDNFATFDYFPIFPWFGLVLIGIFLGNTLYPEGKRNFKISKINLPKIEKALTFLGRNSLIIYFIHQPILIGILIFILKILKI